MQSLLNKYFRFFLRSWSKEFRVKFSAIMVLSLTYSIMCFLIISGTNFQDIVNDWGQSTRVTAYIKAKNQKELEKIGGKLSGIEHVTQASYVPAQKAMERFSKRNQMYSKEFLVELQKQKVFSDYFELALDSNLSKKESLDELRTVAGAVGRVNGVEDVSYGQGWIEQYSSFLRFSYYMTLSIVGIFVILTMLIISNLIRVLISNSREEIEILELVGETPLRTQFPFVVEGTLLSSMSFLFAVFMNIALFSWIQSGFESSQIFYTFKAHMNGPGMIFFLLGISMSALFGGFISWVTVRAINTGWAYSTRRQR